MPFFIAYFVGLAVVIIGVITFMRTDNREKKASVRLLVFLFVAVTVWYIPLETSQGIYTVPEAILSAVLQGVAALKADSYTKETVSSPLVSSLFSFSIMAVRIIILFFIFDMAISLIGVPHQYINNWLKRKCPTVVFCGLNEKTLSIAESMNEKDKKRIIYISHDSPDTAQREKLKNFGGIYFTRPLGYVFRHLLKDKRADAVEVFIFGETDADNMACLSELADAVRNDKFRQVRAYVELNETSDTIQKNIQNRYLSLKKLIISFVNTEEDFAYNNLYENDFLKYAAEENGRKIIKALFIGTDRISVGMIKSALWLFQLPGYRLSMEVVSSGEFLPEFRYACPEIREDVDLSGMAEYHMGIHDNVGYRTEQFAVLMKSFCDFTFAFVNTGDDMLNYNIAADLIMFRRRAGIRDECTIQLRNDRPSVISDTGDKLWKYVKIAGTKNELYSYSYLTNAAIENAARMIHEERQLTKEETERTPWSEYCRDGYKKRSAYVRALSIKYKLSVLCRDFEAEYSLLETDETWMKYEHMRWSVYTLTEGYIYSEIMDTLIGKTHPLLIPFDAINDKKIRLKNAISVSNDLAEKLLKGAKYI